VEVERKVEVEKRVEVAVAQVETRDVVRWRTRVVTKADGTRIETHETLKADEKKSATKTEKQAERIVTQERERLVYRDKLVETSRPGWSLGAQAGLGLDGKPRYGGEVGRRIVGGLWASVAVDVPTRSLWGGVRFEF
jgi:F420-0:gamma-glutamyl ligase